MPNTLYEYYKEKGQSLPSIEERRKTNNLGADYAGTAEQNAALLSKLQTGGTVTTPTTGSDTIGSKYSQIDTTPYLGSKSKDDKALSDVESYYNKQANQKVDENAIYNQKLRQFQKEIDATNQIYGEKLRQQQEISKGNLGTTTAIAARAGALGSPIGEAQYQGVQQQNQAIEGSVRAEQAATIAAILGKGRQAAAQEIAEKRAAKESGLKDYLGFLKDKQTRTTTKLSGLAKSLIAKGLTIDTIDPLQLAEIAKTYGVSSNDILSAYQEESAKKKADYLSVSEGSTIIDPTTGKVIYSAPKTYKPTGGGGGGTSGASNLSTAAQSIVDQINRGGDINDLIKGSSISAQNLRNEVIAGLNSQGGYSTKTTDIMREGKDIVDNLLTTQGYKALGGYSSILGGQLSTGYGDAKAKANQLAAILARDNLGLLKGAMSDKDLAFIQSMSTGFEGEGIQSEGYIKSRLEEIQNKLQNRLVNVSVGESTNGGGDEVDDFLNNI